MAQAPLAAIDGGNRAIAWFETPETPADAESASWGDGFADDRWTQISAVTSWAQCSPDEYIRLFPRLPAGAPELDRCVVDHLARRASTGGDPACRPYLQALIVALRNGVVPDLAPMSSAAFAFHVGLHPAYLWPEALCTAERDTAAGWLGLFDRGRLALMPPDVADYLLDTIVGDGPTIVMRDVDLAALVDTSDLASLRAWAERRVAGWDHVGRLRGGGGARRFGSGTR